MTRELAQMRIQAARELDQRLVRMSRSSSREVRQWGNEVAEAFGAEAARESYQARRALREMKGTGGRRRVKP